MSDAIFYTSDLAEETETLSDIENRQDRELLDALCHAGRVLGGSPSMMIPGVMKKPTPGAGKSTYDLAPRTDMLTANIKVMSEENKWSVVFYFSKNTRQAKEISVLYTGPSLKEALRAIERETEKMKADGWTGDLESDRLTIRRGLQKNI